MAVKLAGSCTTQASEWEERQRLRAEELVALHVTSLQEVAIQARACSAVHPDLLASIWITIALWGKSVERFLYRSVHAAFVNTKWYETWSERTLFVDPIICDVHCPGGLSRMQGRLWNCHRTRHTATGQDTLVVPFSLLFFLLSKVDGWPRPRPAPRVLTRFSQLPSPTCRGDAANPCWSQSFPFIRLCLVIFSRLWRFLVKNLCRVRCCL